MNNPASTQRTKDYWLDIILCNGDIVSYTFKAKPSQHDIQETLRKVAQCFGELDTHKLMWTFKKYQDAKDMLVNDYEREVVRQQAKYETTGE